MKTALLQSELQRTHNWTFHGVQIQQYWNQYLFTTGEDDKVRFAEQLQHVRHGREDYPVTEDQNIPAFVMMGVGAWFSAPKFVLDEADGSVDEMIQMFRDRLSNVSAELGPDYNDFVTAPMDSVEGTGNRVFFVPPAGPFYTGRVPETAAVRTESYNNALKLKQLLRDETENFNFDIAWSFLDLVEGQIGTIVDPTGTGWHVTDKIREVKANIMLNLRCNAKLDRLNGYPYTRTCCTDYGNKTTTQMGFVILGVMYLASCVILEIAHLMLQPKYPRRGSRLFSIETGAFAMAILLCYYADRTHLFAKGEKNWSYEDFLLFMAPCLVIACASIRKSGCKNMKLESLGLKSTKTAPFLSRDQTEEWKGWMQVAILIYHWTAAGNSPTIYILIRVLVAAYLFQTGYGHTTYFLKTKDFSFNRVASVLLRLNLLPCALAYIMNTDYMFYYFSPLCSFWFIVVYITFAAGKNYNNDTQVVLAKICISAVLVTLIIRGAFFFRTLFFLLNYLFNIQWSISEWEYRVGLDSIIVYVGMLLAVLYLKLDQEIRTFLRHTLALAGIMAICGYWYTSMDLSTDEYRSRHPLLSFIPILGFIAIRNASNGARNYYSTAMAWLGKCSLETYTLQFHIFLAADTHGVLLIDAFHGEESILNNRWKSLVFIIPMFLWVSSVTAKATSNLVEIILCTPWPTTWKKQEKQIAYEEEDVDVEEIHMSNNPRMGLVRSLRSGPARCANFKQTLHAVLVSMHLRIFLILTAMCLFNFTYPVPDTHVPDGYTMDHLQ